MTPASGLIVYLAGSRWSDVPGTDRRLATALGTTNPVLWVDPPFSVVTRTRGARERAGVDQVAPGVTRLRILGPPAASRPGVRTLSHSLRSQKIRRTVRRLGTPVAATIVASPRERFPELGAGIRVLYVTDDWIAGASLMGLSEEVIRTDLRRNTSAADLVLAVSPGLADRVTRVFGVPVKILANGCEPQENTAVADRGTSAVLVGQLNERIDIELLEAVRVGGTPLVIIGPRTERDPAVAAALDRLLAADGVSWLGELPSDELPARLSDMGVGLTPYGDSSFNRASFPLKTLEYLASGLPVVSTDTPSVRWLNTPLIEVASGPELFAARVREVLARTDTAEARNDRLTFARGHSWRSRATQLLALIGSATKLSL